MAIENNKNYTLTGSQVEDLAARIKLKGNKSLSGASDPTTSTAGEVGQFYINTTSDEVFYLKSTSTSGGTTTYEWVKVTSAGEGGADWTAFATEAGYIKNKPMENSLAYFSTQEGWQPWQAPTFTISPATAKQLSGNAEKTAVARLTFNGNNPASGQYIDWHAWDAAMEEEVPGWTEHYGQFSAGLTTSDPSVHQWEGFRAYNANNVIELIWGYYHDSIIEFSETDRPAFVQNVTFDNGEIGVCGSVMTSVTGNQMYFNFVILGDLLVIHTGNSDYQPLFLSISQPNGILKTLDQTFLPKATQTVEGITSLQTVTDTVNTSITVGNYLQKTLVNSKPQIDLKHAAIINWEETDDTSPEHILNRPFYEIAAGGTVNVTSEMAYTGAAATANASGVDPQSGFNGENWWDLPSTLATPLGWTNVYSGEKFYIQSTSTTATGYFSLSDPEAVKLYDNIKAGATVSINLRFSYTGDMEDQTYSGTTAATFTQSTTVNGHTYYATTKPSSMSAVSGFWTLPIIDNTTSNTEIGFVIIPITSDTVNNIYAIHPDYKIVQGLSYVNTIADVKQLDAKFVPIDNSTITINASGKLVATGGGDLSNYYTKSEADAKFVEDEAGKGLSSNDYTTAEKDKLAGIATGAEANVQSNWNETNTSSDAYIQNKPTIPANVSDLNNDSGFQTASDVSSAISSALTSTMTYKGTKATVADLPASGNTVGDVWNVTADGMNYAWDGSNWDALGSTIDLSSYLTKTEASSTYVAKENGKGLSSNDFTNADKSKLDGLAETGALNNLTTTTKTNLVAAINEVNGKTEVEKSTSSGWQANTIRYVEGSSTDSYGTLFKTSRGLDDFYAYIGLGVNPDGVDGNNTVISALIKSVDDNGRSSGNTTEVELANKSQLGTLSSLTTTDKTNLVAAINELVTRIAALETNQVNLQLTTTDPGEGSPLADNTILGVYDPFH